MSPTQPHPPSPRPPPQPTRPRHGAGTALPGSTRCLAVCRPLVSPTPHPAARPPPPHTTRRPAAYSPGRARARGCGVRSWRLRWRGCALRAGSGLSNARRQKLAATSLLPPCNLAAPLPTYLSTAHASPSPMPLWTTWRLSATETTPALSILSMPLRHRQHTKPLARPHVLRAPARPSLVPGGNPRRKHGFPRARAPRFAARLPPPSRSTAVPPP